MNIKVTVGSIKYNGKMYDKDDVVKIVKEEGERLIEAGVAIDNDYVVEVDGTGENEPPNGGSNENESEEIEDADEDEE